MQLLVLRQFGKNTGKTTEWKGLFQKLHPKARLQGRTCDGRKLIKVWQQPKALLKLPLN